MKKLTPRTWLPTLIVALSACLFFTVTGWLIASPAEDIEAAVSLSGAENVKTAKADSFVDAFSSVLVGVDEKQSTAYVTAAKQMRPDLSKEIDAAARDVSSGPSDSDSADRHRVSRHRQRVPVCCLYHNTYHTVYIPQQGVQEFLSHHPNCRRGTCASHGHNPQS